MKIEYECLFWIHDVLRKTTLFKEQTIGGLVVYHVSRETEKNIL